MADLVLGLAKSAVEGTLTMAKLAIEEEMKLKRSVQRDLMLISDEFEMMHSFLNVTKERISDDMMRTLVRQVRNMALDVEDCIESVIHLDNKSDWLYRLLPSCIPLLSPATALDEAMFDIELLKARVDAVGQRNTRYSHFSDSGSKPPEQMHQQAVANATALDILVEAREPRKNQTGPMDLVQLINNKDGVLQLQVISVWGTGGDLGKTSIIKEACDDPKICKKFRCRAWVKLMHPFNPHEFIRSLLAEFYKNYCPQQDNTFLKKLLFFLKKQENTIDVLEPMEVMAAAEGILIKEFMKQVSDQRYLVILEDVCSMVEWDTIRAYLPDRNNGSCIVVHTQQFEIASLCIGHSYKVSELKQFSADHSVCVFFKEDGEQSEETAKKKAAREWLNKFQPVGRKTDLYALHVMAVLATNVDVIPVWGIAGVGKSSLVRHVYYKEVLQRRTFKKFGWVNVSHPFNLRELSKSLLLDLHSESLQQGNMLRIKDPIEECCELQHEHRCLVVIDGLQSTEEWDLTKAAFAFGSSGSHIIVITNEESVTTHCATLSRAVWNVKGLEVDGAIGLFKKKVDGLITTGHSGNSVALWDLKKNVLVNQVTPPEKCLSFEMRMFGESVREIHVASGTNFDEPSFPGYQVCEETGSSNLKLTVIELAEPILHKCGGLPKVIVAIAEFLATELKTKEDSEDWSMLGWRMLSNSFMHVLETHQAFGSLRDLFAWVHSYFRTCPDFLKPCIFYLSIFPVNHSIRRRRLVRRWIAEGYSRDTEGWTAEETGEEFFSKLVKLSMIQLLEATTAMAFLQIRMTLCQVNGFFREYIITRSIEENLIFALEGRCSMNLQRVGRHLAIQRSWDRDKNVFESIDFSRLRSLTVFGEWRSFFVSDKMRLLRVLDLEDTSGVTDKDLEQMVKPLPHLKFLSLRGCTTVSRLPDSLGGLRQLQTLDVRDSSVMMLPPAISRLRKLQYIRAGTTTGTPLADDTGTVEGMPAAAAAAETPSLSAPSMSRPRAILVSLLPRFCVRHQLAGSHNGGVEVPGGIGELTAVHTLGVIDVNVARGEAILKELKNLTQLRKLGVSGIHWKLNEGLCSAISGLGHLVSLMLQLNKDNHSCLDGISPPPENLQSLKLYGLVGKLPVWIMQLRNLRKLNLQMTMLQQDEIDVLGDLPKLSILCLCFKEFPDGKLQFDTGFDRLYILEVACNSRLQSVVFHAWVMFNLEVLKIHCCRVSSMEFSGLQHLHELKQVSLSGSYSDALKQHLQSQLAKHRKEIEPVLKEEPRSS